MRYCGSVDTLHAYQRVKMQPHSPDHFRTKPTKEDKRTTKNGHIPYKLQSDNEQGEAMEEVESLGKCLSYSPDAPKAFGIASKRRAHSSRSSRRKGFDDKAVSSLSASRERAHDGNISIANLLVRYQSIVELSSSSSTSSSPSSSSSSSASPSSNLPHNHSQ